MCMQGKAAHRSYHHILLVLRLQQCRLVLSPSTTRLHNTFFSRESQIFSFFLIFYQLPPLSLALFCWILWLLVTIYQPCRDDYRINSSMLSVCRHFNVHPLMTCHFPLCCCTHIFMCLQYYRYPFVSYYFFRG